MDYNKKAHLYAEPFIKGPTNKWMHNVETLVTEIKMGNFVFPVTINDTQYASSYVCSPYNALITYSQDELYKISNPILRFFLKSLVGSLGWLLRQGEINKNVCINNFLLSTNPYPMWQGEGSQEILEHYKKTHPKHAFMYRSLNEFTNKPLMDCLANQGFKFAASRQVYLFDKSLNNFMRRNGTQNDRRALAKGEFQVVEHDEITKADYSRIVLLYNLLYLDKHSKNNPQFSEELIAYWHQNKLLTMKGLRDNDGILQGIIGLFESEAVITAPLVGYNTALPAIKALYRMLIYLILDYSHTENRCLNLSSGASHFKLLRGGTAFIEVTAIYYAHLSWHRRLTWHTVRGLLNGIFVPLLKRYKL